MTALQHRKDFDAVGAAPWSVGYSVNRSSQNPSSLPESLEGKTMSFTNGTNSRSIVGRRHKNTYADAKNARGDWLAAELSRMSVAEVVEITGMTETAVQNVRRRKSKLSHDNLCALLEARPDFRTRFFMSVGGELLVRPDQVIALERAINSVMRGEA